MLLKDKKTGDLVRIAEPDDLFDPFKKTVFGMAQSGEEEQDGAPFAKDQLQFPSGEALPRCWVDGSYRQKAK